MLKLRKNRDGYLTVGLCVNSKSRNFRVHRLVYEMHVGPIPDGYVVNHKDGNKANPCATNLEAITAQANVLHAFRVLGRNATGSKVTPDEVVQIRHARKAGTSLRELSTKYGVTETMITNICTGRAWGRVGGPLVKAGEITNLNPATGEKHGRSKLQKRDVLTIRKRANAGASMGSLAQHFDVAHGTIRSIVLGITWQAVGGPIREAAAAKHSRSKLTEADVITLRERAFAGEPYSTLGSIFGISKVTARNIATGRTWADAPGPIVCTARPGSGGAVHEDPERFASARDLRRQGLTNDEIATKLGFSRSAVYRWFAEGLCS